MCGAVSYSLSAEPLFTALCHCRQCQRQTGSAYSVVTGFPGDALELHGPTGVFDDVGESGGRVARRFCPACGSPVLSELEAVPGMVFMKSGTLDGFAALAPTVEVFCDNAAAFVSPVPGAERFARSNLEGPA